MFDASSPYKGKVTAYDYAIYIADAALYLMKTKPELEITNPYALDDTQFPAAVDLLKAQKTPSAQVLGHRPARRSTGSPTATWSIGTTWQYQANTLKARRRQAGRGRQAQGGRDRLVRHLDDLVEGQAPELHVQVDGLHHLAEGERAGDRLLRRGAGQRRRPAPRPRSSQAGYCDLFHATDEAYFKDV